MKKKLITLILAITLAAGPAVSVYAAEDYHDGNQQQIYVWIQEGDARFCYQNNGGWNTEDMMTGFYSIDGNVYYFSEKETDDWRYGQMVTGTVEVYGGVYTFNSEGHMVSCYGGLE